MSLTLFGFGVFTPWSKLHLASAQVLIVDIRETLGWISPSQHQEAGASLSNSFILAGGHRFPIMHVRACLGNLSHKSIFITL